MAKDDELAAALETLAKVEKPTRRSGAWEPPEALGEAILAMVDDGHSSRSVALALKDNPLGACETTIRRWVQNKRP